MIRQISKITNIKEEVLERTVDKYGLLQVICNTKLIEQDITKLQFDKLNTFLKLHKALGTAEFLREVKNLDSTGKAKDFCRTVLQHEPKEKMLLIYLNGSNDLIGHEVMAEGTVNECVVYPREVVERVLRHNSANVIIAHNHPANSLTRSQADLRVTKKLKEALEQIDIKLLDHIIVTNLGDTVSMMEEGEI